MDLTVAASLQLSPPTAASLVFAEEVGMIDPVICVGGATQSAGLDLVPTVRRVRAPAGIVSHLPEEMIVRVQAGTTVEELADALAKSGQHCPLDPLVPHAATVGGVLAVGLSGIRRLRYGHIRDTLLEARYVASDGAVIKAGAPVVKNVSGYDLCRLLVGSWGTLGFLAEVVLRCTPRPQLSQWFASDARPEMVRTQTYRPSSILWDGVTTFVLLEGRSEEVRAERRLLERFGKLEEVAAPAIPSAKRIGVNPSRVVGLVDVDRLGQAEFMAEVGVGVVHLAPGAVEHPCALQDQLLPAAVVELNIATKRAYDPTGRLNPGVRPW